jgi:hypothetical protein
MSEQSPVTEQLLPRRLDPAREQRAWLAPIRIVTAVLALALLLAGAASVVGFFFIRQSTQTTVFTAPVHELMVNTDTGDVVVRAAVAGEDTKVISKGQSSFRKAKHTEAVSDGVLAVSGFCQGNFIIADACSVDFEIVVPPGSKVQASSSTGNLTISGPSSSVVASTDTGDVRVVGIGGSIQLRTHTGDVDGNQLTSRTASAKTNTGNVTLDFSTAPQQLRADADTGDVQIRVPDDGSVYQVHASTHTGDRSITVPTATTSGRVISATTATGDVAVLIEPVE